jgi:hypothetical protein
MTTGDSHNGSDSQCRLSDQVLANTVQMIDSTIVRAHVSAAGAKDLMGAGRPGW